MRRVSPGAEGGAPVGIPNISLSPAASIGRLPLSKNDIVDTLDFSLAAAMLLLPCASTLVLRLWLVRRLAAGPTAPGMGF